MSESTGVIPRIDEADTEVELSAEELLALSDCRYIDESATGPTAHPPRPATSPSRRKPDVLKASTKRYVSASMLPLLLIGIVSAAYVLTNADRANEPIVNTSQEPAQPEWPAPEQTPKGEPVRFANPFDTNEVFEFPPGTTETDAREAVAEVLMERALSRQET